MLTRLGKVIWPCENPLLILLSKENDYRRLLGTGCVFFASALDQTKARGHLLGLHFAKNLFPKLFSCKFHHVLFSFSSALQIFLCFSGPTKSYPSVFCEFRSRSSDGLPARTLSDLLRKQVNVTVAPPLFLFSPASTIQTFPENNNPGPLKKFQAKSISEVFIHEQNKDITKKVCG
jgi:hypothetical protein